MDETRRAITENTGRSDDAGPTPFPPPAGSAGPAMRETADPNFTAARRDRSDAVGDAGVPRMDTGGGDANLSEAATASGSRQGNRVGSLMTADVAVCNPETPVYYVARMMEERDVGAVPVVESTDSMRPIGIVTDRDIVIRALAKNQEALSLKASDVMSVDLLTVHPDMSLEECVNLMEQRRIRRAIVVDHTGRCCGIVAQADIVRSGSSSDAQELLREVSEPDPANSHQAYH